jgi:hypothetical protein
LYFHKQIILKKFSTIKYAFQNLKNFNRIHVWY